VAGDSGASGEAGEAGDSGEAGGDPTRTMGTDNGPHTAHTSYSARDVTRGARIVRNVTRDTDLATSLEVASSLWAKFMGLMGRRSLPPGSGLWLPASNGIHMMFMRFHIDAVFVGKPTTAGGGEAAAGDGGGTTAGGGAGGAELRPVVSVHPNLRAWTGLVPLVRSAHGVLELPAGTIEASGTQVGDLIRLELGP
jgi:uncharacterized membrane protein (UPF0127 family)